MGFGNYSLIETEDSGQYFGIVDTPQLQMDTTKKESSNAAPRTWVKGIGLRRQFRFK